MNIFNAVQERNSESKSVRNLRDIIACYHFKDASIEEIQDAISLGFKEVFKAAYEETLNFVQNLPFDAEMRIKCEVLNDSEVDAFLLRIVNGEFFSIAPKYSGEDWEEIGSSDSDFFMDYELEKKLNLQKSLFENLFGCKMVINEFRSDNSKYACVGFEPTTYSLFEKLNPYVDSKKQIEFMHKWEEAFKIVLKTTFKNAKVSVNGGCVILEIENFEL